MDKRYTPIPVGRQVELRIQAIDAVLANPQRTLGQSVRHLREAMRLTVPKMSKVSGVSVRTIHDIEAGRRLGAVQTMNQLLWCAWPASWLAAGPNGISIISFDNGITMSATGAAAATAKPPVKVQVAEYPTRPACERLSRPGIDPNSSRRSKPGVSRAPSMALS